MKDYTTLKFKNGSQLDVVLASDAARGGRRHGQISNKNIYLHSHLHSTFIAFYLLSEKRKDIKMVGYIYRITNIITNKCYVGITEDYPRRMKKHIKDLNSNKHHSYKLQEAWNRYGSDKFEWTVREVNITKYDDLYDYEIAEIKNTILTTMAITAILVDVFLIGSKKLKTKT